MTIGHRQTQLLRGAFALIALVAVRPQAALAGEGAPATKSAPAPFVGPIRPDAQALYRRGLARFEARDYPGAVADFRSAYALDPRPELLFAEAQAERLRGDCTAAVILYQRFLASNPPALQVGATQIALARCAQQLAERPPVVVVKPPSLAPPAAPPPPPPRWWKDPWALAASGAGVAALGVGVGFWMASNDAADDAARANTLPQYGPLWSTAQSRRTVSTVAFAAGAALAAAAGVRFALVRRQRIRGEAAFSVVAAPGTLALSGAF